MRAIAEMNGSAEKPRVWFVVYRDGLGATFHSQFVRPMVALRARGYKARVISLACYGEFLRPRLRALWASRVAGFDSEVRNWVHRLPIGLSRMGANVVPVLSAAAWLLSSRLTENDVLHCGGAAAANVMIRARRLLRRNYPRILFHSFGPIAAEFRQMSASPTGLLGNDLIERGIELEGMEAMCYAESDMVAAICGPMLDYALNAGVEESRLTILPCASVDFAVFSRGAYDRVQMRQVRGLDDRFVVMFSGALHPWQNAEAALSLFLEIRVKNSAAFLLFVTPQRDRAESLCKQFGIDASDFLVTSAPFRDMPSWIACADIAVLARGLFRERDIVNELSSPIKAGEFLAMGVPIVVAQFVGDISNAIDENRIGVCVPLGMQVSEAAAVVDEFVRGQLQGSEGIGTRNRCEAVARRQFALEGHLDVYEQSYNALVR